MRLDIACGQAKLPGWVGIDQCRLPGVDLVHDLRVYPWPIESESVTEARCSHYLEHVPGPDRPRFLSEVWRILMSDAGIQFITPLGANRQAQDFTHAWPPVVLPSYLYFDRDWLRTTQLDHYIEVYGINCNFAVVPQAIGFTEEWAGKSQPEQSFAVANYANAATDLVVTLRKKPL